MNIGLYVGVDGVSVVIVDKQKLLFSFKFKLSSLEEKEDLNNEEIKWAALVNKALQRVEGEKKNVYMSVTDRDFILRFLEMPLMKKKEIEASLNFEMERCIPFKLEELVWDYDYTRIQRSKRINVSFWGMKKDTFGKYENIFTHLNMKVFTFEPSTLSLARILKAKKIISKLDLFVLLDFTESESNLSFFYSRLPLFNRHFSAFSLKKNGKDIQRLIEEIRVSFQYLQREFKLQHLNKLIVLCDRQHTNLFSTLKDNLGVETEVIVPQDLLKEENIDVSCLKAYGAALLNYSSYNYRINLRGTERIVLSEEVIWKSTPVNWKLVFGVGVISLLVSLFLFFSLKGEIFSYKLRLSRRRSSLNLPLSIKNSNIKEITNYLNRKKGRMESLKIRLSSLVKIAKVLERLPYLLTEGLWLQDMQLTKKENNLEMSLLGYVFLDDSQKEGSSLDKFISQLKNDEEFKKIFGDVNISFIERKIINNFPVTSFQIKLN